MVVEICGGVWEERESSYLVLMMLLGIFDVITVFSRSQVETYKVTVVEMLILSMVSEELSGEIHVTRLDLVSALRMEEFLFS